MTEQKLRKFRLIDRDGYLDETSENTRIYEDYFTNGVVEGFIDQHGELRSRCHQCLIEECEFKFFEEVFDEGSTPENVETVKFMMSDSEWMVVTEHPTMPKHKIIIETSTNEIDVISDEELADIVKPKTWQEKLCKEYSEKYQIFRYLEYCASSDLIKLESFIEPAELVNFAKRILELSEGDK